VREVRETESEREEEVEVEVFDEATVEIDAEEGERLPDRRRPSKEAAIEGWVTVRGGGSIGRESSGLSGPESCDVEATGLPESRLGPKPPMGSKEGAEGRSACGRMRGVSGQLMVAVPDALPLAVALASAASSWASKIRCRAAA
jgi:hypothetical protein